VVFGPLVRATSESFGNTPVDFDDDTCRMSAGWYQAGEGRAGD
jgi:hypothetical protein